MSIDDVTDRITAAVQPGMSPDDASNARRNVIAAIEKESKDIKTFSSRSVAFASSFCAFA